MFKTVEIKRYENNNWLTQMDDVVEEYPLTLFINQIEWLTLLCSPDCLDALVYGYLFSEGVIRSKSEVAQIILDRDKGHAYVTLTQSDPLSLTLHGKRTQTSGCAKGMTFYHVVDTINLQKAPEGLSLKMSQIATTMRSFNQSSPLFLKTGGVHSSALCNSEGILWIKEDIGRHNAVDKLIGQALIEDHPLADTYLLTSGRISSEILLKCARAGITVIVSRSAPTHLSVALATRLNVTLVGFVRGQRGNVYAGFQRIQDLE